MTSTVQIAVPSPMTVGGTKAIGADGIFRRAARVLGDMLGVVGVAFCFPLVILAIFLPIALVLRALLWLVGLA